MLKGLATLVAFGAFLLGGPDVAKDQKSTSHAAHDVAKQDKKPVAPTHVVIDPPIPTSGDQRQPNAKKDPPADPLRPGWKRPEWVIVYVTIAYAIISFFTLLTIKRQADTMETQATDSAKFAAETLAEMKAQRLQSGVSMDKQARELQEQTRLLGESVSRAGQSANFTEKTVKAGERADVLLAEVSLALSQARTVDHHARPVVTFKNFGRTRATNVLPVIELIVNSKPEIRKKCEAAHPTVLGAGQEFTVRFERLNSLFSDEVIREIYQGRLILTFYGTIGFEDVFGGSFVRQCAGTFDASVATFIIELHG